MKKNITLILIVVFILALNYPVRGWDDETLFTSGNATYSIMKPNVMILMDTSGSMNNLVFHPDYNSETNYTDPAGDYISRWYEYKIEQYNAQTYYDPHTDTLRSFGKGFFFGRRYTNDHAYECT
ncbi:MAG: hypothetical protein ABFR75_09715, partial [Acidobacteriota bacterium]